MTAYALNTCWQRPNYRRVVAFLLNLYNGIGGQFNSVLNYSHFLRGSYSGRYILPVVCYSLAGITRTSQE